ncbi:MAG TPA: efflux RND transporter periplasmic adaptor subunit [Bryobacteraceae bacterium]|nr:efflux RND transporter periplasmic adaptor subunit [Bryobacteraceae bacterium]
MSLVCLLLAVLVISGCGKTDVSADAPTGKGGKKGKGRGGDGGPVPVVVAKVALKNVPIEVIAVGNVEAYSTISVVPQVGGQLTEVFFHEGDYVMKGAKLFRIDPRPLEAMVAQAEANLARDTALLQQATANLARDTANQKYARDQADRYGKLFEEGIVSKDQGEQLSSNADALAQLVLADKASIESAKAQILADKANIDNIKLQLAYTTIYSPIDGRTGNLTVKSGNIVSPNTTILTTITQVEPIYVTFSVPESRLGDVRSYMAQGTLQVAARGQDGTDADLGQLTFVDNNVDTTTGTIKLKGTFQNASRKLWPGEYVNVTLRMSIRQNALVLPNQAVQTGQDGTYVYVVKDDRTVEMRPVTTGLRVDQDMVIDKGVKAGETVVTEGQLRLAPGSRVQTSGANGPGGFGAGREGKGGEGNGGSREKGKGRPQT